MILSAPAKINLFLDVTRRDGTGFHRLRTVFQSVSLHDDVIIEKSGRDLLRTDHAFLQNRPNIAQAALAAFRAEQGMKQAFRITIRKRIPLGAGLGGGSSDAAAVLYGLSRLVPKGPAAEDLCRIGRKLGKDVPFFFSGGLQKGSRYGDVLRPLSGPGKFFVLIVYPGFEISTRESYEALMPEDFNRGASLYPKLVRALAGPLSGISSWPLYNIFEKNAFRAYPVLQAVRTALKEGGAENCLMSGTGSTVFGLFQKESAAARLKKKLKGKYKDIILCSSTYHGVIPV